MGAWLWSGPPVRDPDPEVPEAADPVLPVVDDPETPVGGDEVFGPDGELGAIRPCTATTPTVTARTDAKITMRKVESPPIATVRPKIFRRQRPFEPEPLTARFFVELTD
jgi:hypothetical protein